MRRLNKMKLVSIYTFSKQENKMWQNKVFFNSLKVLTTWL